MRIAGEIALSEDPGGTMKKWREIFGITQAQLGEHLNISPSTISDYESNRRKSPGIAVIKRFVNALLDIDGGRGSPVAQKFREATEETTSYEVHEFARAISGIDFAKLVEAKAVANEDMLAEKKVYGFTLIDSIKVIIDISYTEFPKLYGAIPERAFIFTKVSTGRSPMVVIRVTPMKPSLVVLHGITSVDKLALKLAQKERIPVLVTKMDIKKMSEVLKKI